MTKIIFLFYTVFNLCVMKTELLAPAGSMESLRAAIQAGANAIYFGVEKLNMRACSSESFSLDDIPEVASITREAGIRAYLTVNTVLYDHDMLLTRKIMIKAKEAGINAVIVADPSAMLIANEVGIDVHLSTQANVCNFESVKFYAPFCTTIVLARELNLNQIKKIIQQCRKENIKGRNGEPVKFEIFVHGALCMAVSGKCYLSLHTANSSANRGACKQNCRKPYLVTDDRGNELMVDNEYIMSAKDLCTIDFLDKVIDTGVDVLKIEGRSKGPEYVFETVSCYKEAIQSIKEGSYNPEKVKSWIKRLDSVFNRGFWEGYYLGKKLGEWSDVDGSKASKLKIYLGKSSNFFANSSIAEFTLETPEELKKDDELLITGPTTGLIKLKLEDFRVNGDIKETAAKGDKITFATNAKVRRADKLYKLTER